MTWRQRLDQISGPNVITIWSWIITFPLAIVVSGTSALSNVTSSSSFTALVTLVVVQLLLGFVLWIGYIIFRRLKPSSVKWIYVLLFFGSVGLLRTGLLELLENYSIAPEQLASSRVVTNVLGSILVLSAIAIVVDDYRRHARAIERLDTARNVLSQLREKEQEQLLQNDHRVLNEVREQLEIELRKSDVPPDRLLALAEQLVRPLSHRLAEEVVTEETIRAELSTHAPTRRPSFLALIQSPSPLLVALVIESLVLGSTIAEHGLLFAVLNFFVGLAVVWLGLTLLDRLLSRIRRIGIRLSLLVLGLIATGLAGSVIVSIVLGLIVGSFPNYALLSAVLVLAVGLGASVWEAIERNRQITEEELKTALADEASAIDRIRFQIEWRALQASRFLHGPIQSELIAAAMRGQPSSEIRSTLQERFQNYGTTRDNRTAFKQITDLIESWISVLNVSFQCEEDCWRILEADEQRLSLLLDGLSEGLTNAIRHGNDRDVVVTIAKQDDSVRLELLSHGILDHRVSSGIGLADLNRRARQLTLKSSGQDINLSLVV